MPSYDRIYKKGERDTVMVEILYKSKNAVVIYKAPGVPSQSDPSGDPDAMTLTSEKLGAIGERAFVDMEYMTELTGKSEDELFADLKGVIFLNP